MLPFWQIFYNYLHSYSWLDLRGAKLGKKGQGKWQIGGGKMLEISRCRIGRIKKWANHKSLTRQTRIGIGTAAFLTGLICIVNLVSGVRSSLLERLECLEQVLPFEVGRMPGVCNSFDTAFADERYIYCVDRSPLRDSRGLSANWGTFWVTFIYIDLWNHRIFSWIAIIRSISASLIP